LYQLNNPVTFSRKPIGPEEFLTGWLRLWVKIGCPYFLIVDEIIIL